MKTLALMILIISSSAFAVLHGLQLYSLLRDPAGTAEAYEIGADNLAFYLHNVFSFTVYFVITTTAFIVEAGLALQLLRGKVGGRVWGAFYTLTLALVLLQAYNVYLQAAIGFDH